jgi:uncharacterized protein
MLRSLMFIALLPALAQAQPICALQGSAGASPYEGQQVTTEGIVTAVFQGSGTLNGYTIEQPGCDANGNTSNGIFVYAPNAGSISIGQRVSVTGTVLEFNGLTEITNASYSVLGNGTVLPTVINLPMATDHQWERYEGMLLHFPGTLMVADNSSWSQYGEVVLSPDRPRIPTDRIDPNDADPAGTTSIGSANVAAVLAAQNLIDRSYILLDDSRTNTWPTPIPWADNDGTLRAGSTVSDLTGVLHFSFGAYKIESPTPVVFQHALRPSVPEVGGTLRAAAINVLNYFTTLGDWGASNAGELGRQRTKLVAAIQAMNADVLALSEIENSDDAWTHLLAGLNAVMGPGTYAVREEDGFGQGTRTVILYKPAVLTPITELYWLNTGIFQRPHLTQGFQVNTTGGRFLFSTMHLRSKICDNASGANLDQGDGQGCYNDLRRSQVSALVDHWAGVRSASGIDAQLIMGDLNAYTEEDPLDRLRASGLVDQLVDGGYTHSYASMFGSLDHAFATAAMNSTITGTSVWHINTDEPSTLDYRESNLSRYQPNAFRCSDHDPVLVGFNGAGLVVSVADDRPLGRLEFALGGTLATWRSNAAGTSSVPIDVLDARGVVVRRINMQSGQATSDLADLASGAYVWLAQGFGAGRFLLP